MNINLTLLSQAVAFGIFIWFTVKFVWPPLLGAIEQRQKTIAEGLAAAEKGKAAEADAKQRIEAELAMSRTQNQGRLADAEKLKIKTGLVIEIRKAMRSLGLTQQEAAKRMSISQPKVSDMMRGSVVG